MKSKARFNKSFIISHAWRSVWRMRYRMMAVCLIAASGIAMYVGAYSAIDSLFKHRDMEYSKGNIADLEIRFAPEDMVNLPPFDDLTFVEGYLTRLVFPGHITLSSGDYLTTLLITLKPEEERLINKLRLIKGKDLDPDDPTGVLVERSLLEYHGYDIGDEIEISSGKDTYQVIIRGVVLSPEFLIAPANPSVFVPTKGSLGVVYASPNLIGNRLGFTLVNSILFKLKPDIDIAFARQQLIDRASSRLTIDWTTLKYEQFGYRFLEADLNAFKIFLPAIVIVFALTTFLVILFLIFQWVTSEHQRIGMLMAMGFKKQRIALAYLYPALLIGLFSILIGIFFSAGNLHGFATNYAASIGFPSPSLAITPGYIVFGAIWLIIVIALAIAWPLAWLLKLTPKDALQQVSGLKEMPPGAISRYATAILKRTWLRFALRNLIRNRLVSIMTIVAVALGLGVTASFFISLSSFVSSAVSSMERDPWDLTVDFFAPVWVENLTSFERITGVEKIVPYMKGVAQLVNGSQRQNMYMLGLPPDSYMRVITIVEGRGLLPDDVNVVVIEKGLAKKAGLRVGEDAIIEARGRQHKAKVVGILSGALPGETYLPLRFAREVMDLSERSTGLFIKTEGNKEYLKTELYKHPDVAQVMSKIDIIEDILQTTGQIAVIIHIGAVSSIGVALLFIFSGISFTVLQRKGEYGMLQILGFSKSVVGATIVAEVVMMGLSAALLAIPVGYLSAEYLNSRFSESWFTINTFITAKDFLVILLPGLLLMPIAALPAIWIILRQPLEEGLRVRRFE